MTIYILIMFNLSNTRNLSGQNFSNISSSNANNPLKRYLNTIQSEFCKGHIFCNCSFLVNTGNLKVYYKSADIFAKESEKKKNSFTGCYEGLLKLKHKKPIKFSNNSMLMRVL